MDLHSTVGKALASESELPDSRVRGTAPATVGEGVVGLSPCYSIAPVHLSRELGT